MRAIILSMCCFVLMSQIVYGAYLATDEIRALTSTVYVNSSLDVKNLVYLHASPSANVEAEAIRFGRLDSNIRYHSINYSPGTSDSLNFIKFNLHDGGSTPPFQTQNTVMTLVGNSRSVGIGTALPTTTLDVNGSVTIDALLANNTRTHLIIGSQTANIGTSNKSKLLPDIMLTARVYDASSTPSVNKIALYNQPTSFVSGFGISTNSFNTLVGPLGGFNWYTGTTDIIGTGSKKIMSVSSLGELFVNGSLGIGTLSPRGILDVNRTTVTTLSAPQCYGAVVFYPGSGMYYADNSFYNFTVYSYRDTATGRIFSPTGCSNTGTDANDGANYYMYFNWNSVANAGGYRVVVNEDPQYGAYGYYYFDTTATDINIGVDDLGYVSEIADYYAEGPFVLTPTSYSVGPDLYINSTTGDLTTNANINTRTINTRTLNAVQTQAIITNATSLYTDRLNINGAGYVIVRTSGLTGGFDYYPTPTSGNDFIVAYEDDGSAGENVRTYVNFGRPFNYGYTQVGNSVAVPGTVNVTAGTTSVGLYPAARAWAFTSQDGGSVYYGTSDNMLFGFGTDPTSSNDFMYARSSDATLHLLKPTKVWNNLTVQGLINLTQIVLPTCNADNVGMIGRNATATYGCNATAWVKIF